jgi:hypothetical protein
MSIHDAIPAEVDAASQSYRGILLRGVSVFLRDTGHGNDAAMVEGVFTRFPSGSLSAMVDTASPAVWLHAQQIYARGSEAGSDIRWHVLQFLVASFDSFWGLLRPGDTLELGEVGCKPICLPNLQTRICVPWMTLARLGNACAIQEDGRFTALDRSPSCRPLSSRRLAYSEALVLGEANPDLFDAHSFNAMKAHDVDLLQFADEVSAALLMIREVMPKVARTIDRKVQWYVPLNAPPNVHRSHTSSSLPGAIFLSQSKNTVMSADAIVHEYAHNHLNDADKVCGLVTGDDPEINYSPWRPDSRPMRGLIHGLFAFACVSEFLSLVERRMTGNEKEFIRARRCLIAHRLHLALKQLDRERLTRFTCVLADHIQDFSNALVEALQLDLQDPPAQIREHVAAWTQRYPEYRVQM